MLRFSIKNVFRKRIVAVLSSIGIGFGLMLMFVLGAFSAGVQTQFENNFSKVLGVIEIMEKSPQGSVSAIPTNITDILLQSSIGGDIIAYNIYAEFPPLFTLPYTGTIRSDNNRDILKLTGLNVTLDRKWEGPSTRLIQGRLFEPNSDEVIVDSRLSSTDGFSLAINDSFTIFLQLSPLQNTTKELTVVGIYEQEESGAPSFVPSSYYLYTEIETAWRLLGEAGYQNTTYSSIDLRFPALSNEDTEKYISAINNMSTAGEFGNYYVQAFSLAQFQTAIQDTLTIFNSFTTVISIITALAGGMAIIVSQLSSVQERKVEFAILKSTGWKNSHIFKDVVYESLTLGILGAIIGMTMGFILIKLFSSGFGPFGGSSAEISWPLMLQVLSFALGIGLLGGFYPGLKAARVRPVIVLKGN